MTESSTFLNPHLTTTNDHTYSQLIIVNTVPAKTQTLCTNYLNWYRLSA